MNKAQFRRLLSLIPDRQQSPINTKLFEIDLTIQQPKIKPKQLFIEELPLFLNQQHIQILPFVPQRMKTEVYKKMQQNFSKPFKSEDERYNTIDVVRSKSRKPTEVRKVSCTNSYQIQQQQNKMRKLRYSYESRRRQNSINKFNFEAHFYIFVNANPSLNINKIRINKQIIFQKLVDKYRIGISQKIMNFFEIPQYIDFQFWKSLTQKLLTINQEQIIVFIYRLIHNHRHLSSTDLFQLGLTTQSEAIQKDIQTILTYIQQSLNTETIDNEEIEYLRKSSIFKDNLTLTNLLTWTEIYQIDVIYIVYDFSNQKQLNKQKDQTIENHIYMTEDKEDSINYNSIISKYPNKYEQNEPFSINFPIFRRIFQNQKIHLWNDIYSFFTGQNC
ncbi:unnamed protein product (macronuclear) [Paramecium tetraurelia]|uniref:Uncharacterized protein n=1 Tax=Paramecium tetraurelia TaxID=5888 RepID=A0DR29_PARTE|nr:uncharacterized protein GSPATT00002897001 [Paramecium tetraurelia]CAK85496.1 unnamed protein product [Paramecium tetraurelia]|eukprot:XP_001452893.1 hypothetical protein (macronuclear) [Paramecium tetraurelia strain d4-2]